MVELVLPRHERRARRLVSSAVVLGLAAVGFTPPGVASADEHDPAANKIITENALPGTPESEWDVSGAGDPTIQGFTTDISADLGGTVEFKIDTTASAYDIEIYRLGYYGGDGARLVDTISAVTGTDQPDCSTSAIPMGGGATTSGELLDCGNWPVSATWPVPADATSGVYIARPTRTDDGGASHIPFVVRDDASTSDLLFQTSDTTWQSYNPRGGYNAYGSSGATMAEKLSYNRPFATRGAELENYLFNAEYPMIRWLERNGYDVSYMSAIDTERHANLLTNHDVFLSVGHDEYWSQGRRDAVTAARDAGVHLAFFSANEIYWKTRWEPSTADGGSTDYRTQVVYKEGTTAPSGSAEHRNCYNNYECDPSDIWTGQWREAPGAVPENSLSGQISWRLNSESITVPDEYAPLRFWRNTDVAALEPGGTVTLADGTLGYEWDPEYPEYAEFYPAGRVLLSSTTTTTFTGAAEDHHLSLYRADSGALVFGAGTVQWSWGLDSNHDRGSAPEDRNVQQATVNLFADMGVQPATLQSNLVAATASTDTAPPTVTVTSPVAGATVPGGSLTVTGTASDADGVVGAVEVSTDGGSTWQRATGRESWSHTYAAPEGNVAIQVRATDDSINLSAPVTHTFTVAARTCPCTIFPDSATPAQTNLNDNQAGGIEVGVKFRAEQDGFITGLRYHWTPGDAGTHTGNLWTASGQLLATAEFPTPTTAGWQNVQLDAPVAITAGTTYVASQHSSAGYYPSTGGGFTDAFVNPPLTALATGTDGGNGLYRYGASAFPTDSFGASNYWVDVVFATETGPDTAPPTVVGRAPAPGATGVAASTDVTVTFSEPLDRATVDGNIVLRDADGATVTAALAYDATTRTATLDPGASLLAGAAYTVVVAGGETGVADLAGNRLAADDTWAFTVSVTTGPRPDPNVGPGGPVLVVDGTGPFGSYLPEIMRAEGLNLFTVGDTGALDASGLAPYRTVVLGETTLSGAQVTALTDWVEAGGNLVALRPDPALAPLLGLSPDAGTLAEGYLRVDTSTAPGAGIVGETMQFHGVADRYSASAGAGTQVVATLYSDATTATTNPAVTLREVGTAGGSAAAFTYDLARSIVLTRQGNPAWADINGDGSSGPFRADDLFHNGTDPDWVNLDKVAIPQADEQQRLLANILTLTTRDALPLPRFWYLPGDEVAAVVMTADEHNGGDVRTRLEAEKAASPAGCSVSDWECIRSTVYLYPNYPSLTAAEASAYEDQGFEIALHPNTSCGSPTRAQYTDQLTTQLGALESRYPGVEPSVSSRNHCIAWSGYTTIPEVLVEQGIHVDTNYYFWPEAWVKDRPGMFTGSGFPQRFATEGGELIDVYQAATQFTDESGQSFPATVTALMDGAIEQGYYGAFVGNFHTDGAGNSYHGPVIAAAQERGVPVISAKQLMTWTDGRNASSFSDLTRDGDTVTFSVDPAPGAVDLRAMLPVQGTGGTLQTLSRDGSVAFDTRTIKGVDYAVFDATAGTYTATYAVDATGPAITSVESVPGAAGTATIRWTTTEPATSRVDYGTTAADLGATVEESALTTTHEVELTGLEAGTTYHFRVTSADAAGNTAVSPAPPAAPATFTMPSAVATDTSVADFAAGATGSTTYVADTAGGEVTLAPTVGAEFGGTALPSGWESGAWTTGGTAAVGGGNLVTDGAWARTTDLYDPGHVLEFRATLGNNTFTNTGLAVDFDTTARWAAFGVGNTAGQLYARVNNGAGPQDVALGSGYFGAPHTYRIEWTATEVRFLIDGALVHTSPQAITGQMRPVVSDYAVGGSSASVDWVRMTPYASSGTFLSRIHGAGSTGAAWGAFSYVADVPSGTALTFDVRTGATPTPDGSWTEWTPIEQGADVATTGRYLQYQVTATGTGAATPALQSVTLPYTAEADTDPPAISDRTPAPGATAVPVDAGVTVTFDEPMDPATITSSTVTLRADGGTSEVPVAVTYSGVAATLDPTADLAYGTTYTVAVAGSVTDLAGNALGSADSWTFTTLALAGVESCPCSIWEDPLPTPGTPAVTDGQPIEVGVKFRSERDGFVTGVRFYKGEANTGTHIGHLWSSAGELLAEATFTDETASGWQQVDFSEPVPVTAGSTYVASYHSSSGYFAIDAGFFTSTGVSNQPLEALQSGVDGPNGVFRYGASGFPSEGNTANYWVDVVFEDTATLSVSGVVTGEGEPLAGASVNVYSAETRAWLTNTLSAADGSYSITGLPAGDYKLFIKPNAPGYPVGWHGGVSFDTATVVTVSGATTVDIGLVGAYPLSGVVTGEGEPLAGASVNVYSAETRAWLKGALSAADGSYSITGLPAGDYKLFIKPNAPGYPVGWHGGVSFDTATVVTVSGATTVDIGLVGAYPLSGVVTGEGEPLAGASVNVYSAETRAWLKGALSAADGSYSITGLPAGDYKLFIKPNAPGYPVGWHGGVSFDTATVVTVSGATTVDIGLVGAYPLSGVVTGEGEPLAGASVNVYSAETRAWLKGALSAADGSYSITGLPAGDYKLFIKPNAPGYPVGWHGGVSFDTATVVTVSGATTVDIGLVGAYPLSGVVTGEGEPLAGASVNVYSAETRAWLKGALSAADGSYSITGLPAGDYKLFIKPNAPGYPVGWHGGVSFDTATVVTVSGATTVDIDRSAG